MSIKSLLKNYPLLSSLREDSNFLVKNPEYCDENAEYMSMFFLDEILKDEDDKFKFPQMDITLKKIPLNFSNEDLIDSSDLIQSENDKFDFDIDRVTSEKKKNIKDPEKMPYELKMIKEIAKQMGCDKKLKTKANLITCIQNKYYGREN